MNRLGWSRVWVSITLGLVVVTVTRMGAANPAFSAQPTPATQAVVLTHNRIMSVDLANSRVVTSRGVMPGTARKVVQAGAFVLLQLQRAVEILDPRTLERIGAVEFHEDIRDVAAAGSLMFVATGTNVHTLRVSPDGKTLPQKPVRLPKPADALTARGSWLYVIDDIATPLYAHLVDIRRPEAPRVTSIQWSDTNAHLQAQAVADRWYVLVSYTTIRERGQYLVILPARPPLRELGRRVLAVERKPLTARASPTHFVEEFRVYRHDLWRSSLLHGISRAGSQVWLVSRSVDQENAPINPQMRLGVAGDFPAERRGVIELVGSRLYVAAPSALVAFDIDPPSARVTRFETPAPIVSFALAESTK